MFLTVTWHLLFRNRRDPSRNVDIEHVIGHLYSLVFHCLKAASRCACSTEA